MGNRGVMTEVTSVGVAKFERGGNDLTWTYWCTICMNDDLHKWMSCQKRRINWSGYDDQYWWDNVSKSEQSLTRLTPCGKKLRIAHRGYVSEEVFEVDCAAQVVCNVKVT